MWRDCLLIIGFIVSVLAWAGITPYRLRELAPKHVPSKRFLLLASICTCLSISGIVLSKMTGTGNWWYYIGFSWMSMYLWLMETMHYLWERHIWRWAVLLAWVLSPLLLLTITIPLLDNTFQTHSFTGLGFGGWFKLGGILCLWLLAGINIGGNIFYAYTTNRLEILELRIETLYKMIDKIQDNSQ